MRRSASSRFRISLLRTPGRQVRNQLGSEHPRRADPQPARTGPLLAVCSSRRSGLANRGQYDEAIALASSTCEPQGPSAAAYYLMGVIYQAAANR